MPPAARIADVHRCPLGGACPHVGGPIAAGDATVLVGGRALSRVGDDAECVGATDHIAEGCDTVLIGGKKAARMGDTTAHGGVIVQGDLTVLIGPVKAARGGEGEAGTGSVTCRGKVLYSQEKRMSCAQATSRMILETMGKGPISEETLRNESAERAPFGYDELNGTYDWDVPLMLQDHGVQTGGVWQQGQIQYITAASATGEPAALLLRNPNHFVVVDGVEQREDGTYVLIRDPGLPGAQGCREIKVGGPEWNQRVLDPADQTKTVAEVLRIPCQ